MTFMKDLFGRNDYWILFSDSNDFQKKIRSATKKDIYINNKYSKIIKDGSYLIKLISPQKPSDYTKRLINSQAKREFYGANSLKEIGIKTPKVYGYGVNLNPFNNIDSLLFMENINYITSLKHFFKQKNNSHFSRDDVFNILVEDITKFLANKVYHKDANLNNILLTEDKKIYWIDNDIAPLNRKNINKFFKFFLETDLFYENEKELLKEKLRSYGFGL